MPFYAAVLVAAWFVWPTSLGGCTTLTYVNGHSMEPTYETGDIVVSRCGEPRVGDVVVYAPESEPGVRIIHRVIGGDADGWVVRGDNNSFTDPFEPTDDEVLGVARLHVPKVGLVLRGVANVWLWVGLLFCAAALWVWPARQRADEADGHDDADDADDATDERDGDPADRDAHPEVGPEAVLDGARETRVDDPAARPDRTVAVG